MVGKDELPLAGLEEAVFLTPTLVPHQDTPHLCGRIASSVHVSLLCVVLIWMADIKSQLIRIIRADIVI